MVRLSMVLEVTNGDDAARSRDSGSSALAMKYCGWENSAGHSVCPAIHMELAEGETLPMATRGKLSGKAVFS